MLRLNEIKLPYRHDEQALMQAAAEQLRLPRKEIAELVLLRRSLDCRRKPDIRWVYSVAVRLKNEAEYVRRNRRAAQWIYHAPIASIAEWLPQRKTRMRTRPVVVGMGPAGLFAALTLAMAGCNPIVIERGAPMHVRKQAVDRYFQEKVFDPNANIAFGEGGAGTFSDGKLNTGIGAQFVPTVLHELVRHGAPAQIVWDAKPHIGTDLLSQVVVHMREAILALGGEIRFFTRLTDLHAQAGKLHAISVVGPKGSETIETDHCIVAVGHSARDTFQMLAGKVQMEQKPFAIGVRIEHLQADIQHAQYGNVEGLPPAEYKCNVMTDTGRGCFTFCMCPGGVVVPAASCEHETVTNGMSYHARDGVNANSALLVGVTPEDFGSQDVLAGVEFQRKWESAAYRIAGDGRAPAQRVGDFLSRRQTTAFGQVRPTYPLGVIGAELDGVLPSYVTDTLRAALPMFDRRLQGFAHPDAVLTGVETRSSSPVRIVRDEACNSSLIGCMPCGEGAGYAGGITSAAADGIRVALAALHNAE